jgi:sugar lactone lactonase YvrE
MPAELVLDARNATGESPVWHALEQALYWVDIPARTLNRWHAVEGHAQWTADEMIACIAPRADVPGEWIAGMESGLFSLRPHAGGTLAATSLAKVEHAAPAMRFNDGRCDRQGRFWAGTMLLDMAAGARVGRLYSHARGDTDAALRMDDLHRAQWPGLQPRRPHDVPVADSHPRCRPSGPSTTTPTPARPQPPPVRRHERPARTPRRRRHRRTDGCYWICGNDAGLVHRFTPEGRLDRSLEVPVKKPTMCAFGGDNLDTLFVTSIRPGGSDLSDQPLAGAVFVAAPGRKALQNPSRVRGAIFALFFRHGHEHFLEKKEDLTRRLEFTPYSLIGWRLRLHALSDLAFSAASQATELRSADIHPDNYPTTQRCATWANDQGTQAGKHTIKVFIQQLTRQRERLHRADQDRRAADDARQQRRDEQHLRTQTRVPSCPSCSVRYGTPAQGAGRRSASRLLRRLREAGLRRPGLLRQRFALDLLEPSGWSTRRPM